EVEGGVAPATVQGRAVLVHVNDIEGLVGGSAADSLARGGAVEHYSACPRRKGPAVVSPVAADVHGAAVALQRGARINLHVFEVAAANECAALYAQQATNG